MMPALWMTALSAGKSAMSLAAKARMLAAFSAGDDDVIA
jgi:hypothetical protein